MISVVHFEGTYVTWKGLVRFMRFMDQPNIVNIENSEIGVLSELSIHELYSQKEIQSILGNHLCKMKTSLCFLNVDIFLLTDIYSYQANVEHMP